MTLPEEEILKDLDWLLTSSEPGAVLHHMLVVAAPTGPLGAPDYGNLHRTVYAIDNGERGFFAKVIALAAIENFEARRAVVFAGLSQEMFAVVGADELSADLQRQGRLSEHPRAVEATIVYAACADGRRWFGRRWLTGPDAGKVEDANLLVGPPIGGEGKRLPTLLRELVGLDRRPEATAAG